MQNNVIFADKVNVESTLPVSNNISYDEIQLIAIEIWKNVISKNVQDANQQDKLLEDLQKEYKDFAQAFPLVLRWMVQMRQFKSTIFKKYLQKVASAKISNREEYLDLQAEYLVMMYRYKNSHIEEHKVQEYRRNLIQSLIDEDKLFKEIQKEVEAQMKIEAKEANEERKKKIYTMLMEKKIALEEATIGDKNLL